MCIKSSQRGRGINPQKILPWLLSGREGLLNIKEPYLTLMMSLDMALGI